LQSFLFKMNITTTKVALVLRVHHAAFQNLKTAAELPFHCEL